LEKATDLTKTYYVMMMMMMMVMLIKTCDVYFGNN
jgi:hypothetical protein